MKKRERVRTWAVLLIIGYLAQQESDTPAGDEAPTAAQETELLSAVIKCGIPAV